MQAFDFLGPDSSQSANGQRRELIPRSGFEQLRHLLRREN